MAQIHVSMKHGQTPDVARAIFVREIDEASAKYAKWIQRVDWSPDRASATLSGPGFEIRTWHDDQEVHAKGNVPLFIKILEAPLKAMIQQTIARNLPR